MGRKKGIQAPIKVTTEPTEIVLRLHSEKTRIAVIARTVSLSRNTVHGIIKAQAPTQA